MKPGAGHAKGASFERQVCKELSLWLSEGKHDDLLWRSAMSGGRATVQFKRGRSNRSQTGDLSPISALGEKLTNAFVLECKHYADLQLTGLYMGSKSGVNVHWQETIEDARRHGKWPLLIAKQNRLPTFVLMDRNGIAFLDLHTSVIAHFRTLGVYVLWYEQFLKKARRPA